MYQKDKVEGRMGNAGKEYENNLPDKKSENFYYCGRDQHPNAINIIFRWKESCLAMKATWEDCKEIGHFANMTAYRQKRIKCMKGESITMARSIYKSTHVMKILAMGRSKNAPRVMVTINVEAETDANITLLKAEILQD